MRNLLAFLLMLSCSLPLTSCSNPATFPEAEAQDVDSGELAMAFDIAGEVEGMKSLLVAENGVVIGERYFNGTVNLPSNCSHAEQ